MHGVTRADRAKEIAIDPDAKIRIIYSKTSDGSKWVQTTYDLKTSKMLHNYTGGVTSLKKVQYVTNLACLMVHCANHLVQIRIQH